MSINSDHFRLLVVRPTLVHLDLWSLAAEELLMLTWAQESLGGGYLRQGYKILDDACGVGLGVFSMEPATVADIHVNFLAFQPKLRKLVMDLKSPNTDVVSELVGNLYYATAMARVHYYRAKEPLPPANDARQLASYWDFHYNSIVDNRLVRSAIDNYKRYVTEAK